jgi:tryptophan halogenase
MKQQYNIVVVGGGTAGMMAASYMKAFWGPTANIRVIYDHNTPGIGVGESLTPVFDAYLKVVGITTIELIQHCNATIKLGLKFHGLNHHSILLISKCRC